MTLAFLGLRVMHPIRAVGYMFAQFIGSILGALLVWGSFSSEGDNEVMMSVVNRPADGINIQQAFLIETILTYLLIIVVLETAVNKVSYDLLIANRKQVLET